MKKDVKLYNLILPTFMLFALSPLMWILSLTGNFIIDSIVLFLVSLVIHKRFSLKMYKSNILLVWVCGFVSDFIGAIYLFVVYRFVGDHHEEVTTVWQSVQEGIHYAVDLQSMESIWGIIYMASGILVAAVMIFIFDYAVFKSYATFKSDTDVSRKQTIISALMFAIFTAPYTYFLPSESFDWFFNLFSSIGYIFYS